MNVSNFTGDENQKTIRELACSAELTGEIHDKLIFLSMLNIFLSVTTFLGNTLILVALRKESSLHPPSKLLYRNLATTDLCVGIIAEPLEVTYWLSLVNERWNICHYANVANTITGYILCSVSLLTMAAISVDRLLALVLGLRYRQVVTLKRTYLTVIILWVVSIVTASVFLWNYLITIWYGYIVISLSLVTSIFSYTKIILALRHHQIHIQDHVYQDQPISLNMAQYRKALSSTLWLQVTLMFCYLPYSIVVPLSIQSGLSSSVYLAREFASTLVYLNSSLNPILYCWKISEVRQAVKDTVRQLFCSSS